MKDTKSPVVTAYNRLSLWLHWLTVPAIFIMYLTAQAGQLTAYHLVFGPVLGAFLVFRTAYRVKNGALRPDTEGNEARSHTAIIWILLATIPLLVISGILMVWADQQPLQLLGLEIESPWMFPEQANNIISTTHRTLSHLLLPVLVLHIVISKASERIFTTSD